MAHRFGVSSLPGRLLVSGLLVVYLPFILSMNVSRAQERSPIRTKNGLLAGVPGLDPSVTVYRGIPFAAPPVGERRWKAPEPAASWDGVRKADQFSPGCMQNVAGSRPPWTEEFMHQGEVSEDCLYLNVWNAGSPDEGKPVLVYIHGGGFSEGSGSVALYDGEQLARKGLVVVTLNYRLGVFGFFTHPQLTAESSHHASGNYGLLDQVAALQWVRNNARAFGGDPDNVTIAGQSAGAMSVYLLTVSPTARGLFHRAIIQSGPGGLAAFGLVSNRTIARPLFESEGDGERFATAKGVSSLEALRALSSAELMAPVKTERPVRFAAVVDGLFLPDRPDAIYARGEQNDVPTLTGLNADEGSAFPGYGKVTPEQARQQIGERYGELAGTFVKLYPIVTPAEAGPSMVQSARDLAQTALQRLAVERAKTSKTNIYLYYFERGIPWPERPEFAAFHTAEVPYVFSNLTLLARPWEPVDRRLAETASSYWANFAANGDPNGAGLPVWPAYEGPEGVFMRLGTVVEPARLPDRERFTFFQEVLGKMAP